MIPTDPRDLVFFQGKWQDKRLVDRVTLSELPTFLDAGDILFEEAQSANQE